MSSSVSARFAAPPLRTTSPETHPTSGLADTPENASHPPPCGPARAGARGGPAVARGLPGDPPDEGVGRHAGERVGPAALQPYLQLRERLLRATGGVHRPPPPHHLGPGPA